MSERARRRERACALAMCALMSAAPTGAPQQQLDADVVTATLRTCLRLGRHNNNGAVHVDDDLCESARAVAVHVATAVDVASAAALDAPPMDLLHDLRDFVRDARHVEECDLAICLLRFTPCGRRLSVLLPELQRQMLMTSPLHIPSANVSHERRADLRPRLRLLHSLAELQPIALDGECLTASFTPPHSHPRSHSLIHTLNTHPNTHSHLLNHTSSFTPHRSHLLIITLIHTPLHRRYGGATARRVRTLPAV